MQLLGYVERLMMRFLRHRGWIVFWLDDPHGLGRCSDPWCFLNLYLDQQKREEA